MEELVGKIMMIKPDLPRNLRGQHAYMTQVIFKHRGMIGKVVSKYYDRLNHFSRPIYRIMIDGKELPNWLEEGWLMEPLIDNRKIT